MYGQSHQFHLFPSNPYPAPPPPPPIAHKVWILDCKSCGMFLTNRAMKAVLLLRPNVSLYSSDALPVNCSAYSPDPDPSRLSTNCHPTVPPSPARTCECLTQTLCCHGCGNPVGYMIVIPCTRCTSSITTSNRATNGHRFVFHSSEIVGTERHYVPDEPGVVPYEPAGLVTPTPVAPSQQPSSYYSPYSSPRDTPSPHLHQHPTSLSYVRPSSPGNYGPAPALEYANPVLASSPHPPANQSNRYFAQSHYPMFHQVYRGTSHPLRPASPPSTVIYQPTSGYRPSPRSPSPSLTESREGSASPPPLVLSNLSGLPLEYKEQAMPRHLRAGDAIFWHHLTRSGEIPGVQDDEDARRPRTPRSLEAETEPRGISADR